MAIDRRRGGEGESKRQSQCYTLYPIPYTLYPMSSAMKHESYCSYDLSLGHLYTLVQSCQLHVSYDIQYVYSVYSMYSVYIYNISSALQCNKHDAFDRTFRMHWFHRASYPSLHPVTLTPYRVPTPISIQYLYCTCTVLLSAVLFHVLLVVLFCTVEGCRVLHTGIYLRSFAECSYQFLCLGSLLLTMNKDGTSILYAIGWRRRRVLMEKRTKDVLIRYQRGVVDDAYSFRTVFYASISGPFFLTASIANDHRFYSCRTKKRRIRLGVSCWIYSWDYDVQYIYDQQINHVYSVYSVYGIYIHTFQLRKVIIWPPESSETEVRRLSVSIIYSNGQLGAFSVDAGRYCVCDPKIHGCWLCVRPFLVGFDTTMNVSICTRSVMNVPDGKRSWRPRAREAMESRPELTSGSAIIEIDQEVEVRW